MRILHFLPVYAPAWNFGGPVLSVSRLCEGLVKQGADVRVITTNAGLPDLPLDALGKPLNKNGVHVTYYPVDHQGGTIRSRALVQSLPEHMQWAELLHLSSIWQPLGIPIQKSAHEYGLPVIQTLRGALGPYSWKHGWWKKIPYFFLYEKALLQRTAAIHCTTPQEEKETSCLRLSRPLRILPNPLDLSQLRFDSRIRHEWRERLGLSDDRPLLLVAGRLHHKKGLDILPNILKSITDQPWHLLFVGPDSDGTGRSLRRELRRKGLDQRCTWLESLPSEDLVGPYNAADCLILPSRHENFGNVAVEALSCGCSILISDMVAVGDLLSGCPNVYIRPRNTIDWIETLRSILNSKSQGQISADWVSKRFSTQVIARDAMTMYEEVLKEHYA